MDARTLLEALEGHTIDTGEHNEVLGLEGDHVRVATEKSPEGRLVEIGATQNAMDLLEREHEVRLKTPTAGRRSGFVGATLLTLPVPSATSDLRKWFRPR